MAGILSHIKVADVVEVPHHHHPVTVEKPRKRRKEFPFEGYVDFQGLKIHIENKAGSYRKGTDKDGHEWKTLMHYPYGEVEDTTGVDGDPLDVYVGPNHDSSLVVAIHQHKPNKDGTPGAYDECKVMLGFDTEADAVAAYKKQYDRPGFYKEGDYIAMPIGKFWRWVHDRKNDGKKVASAFEKIAILHELAQFGADHGEALAITAGAMKANLLGKYGKDLPGLKHVFKPYYAAAAHSSMKAGIEGQQAAHAGVRAAASAFDPHVVGHYEQAHALGKQLREKGITEMPHPDVVREHLQNLRSVGAPVSQGFENHAASAVTPTPLNTFAHKVTQWFAPKTAEHVAPAQINVEGVVQATQPILVCLLALYNLYYFAHWTAKGQASYADHQLFERLYKSTQEEYDKVAERLVGLCGAAALDGVFTMAAAKNEFWVKQCGQGDTLCAAQNGEAETQSVLATAYRALDENMALTLGLDELIMNLASQHETNSYLLKQRADTAPTEAPKTAGILAHLAG